MAANTHDAGPGSVVSDFKNMISEAEALLQATAGESGERLATLRARLEDSLHAATQRLLDVERALMERTREAARATDDYVHDNPWKTAGVAAAVGLLLGLLISRR